MRFNDAILMAFADGELPPEEAARIETALAEDSELAVRVQRFRAVRTALRTVYDSVAAEPIPEHLRALLGDVASSEPAFAAPQARVRARRFGALPATAIAAIAVALIIGVLAGRLTAPGADGLFEAEGGRLHAGPALARVLDTRLSNTADNADAAIRIGLSFKATDGALCRTFRRGEVSGLACRGARAWIIPIAANDSPAESQRDMVAASATVMAMVDAMIDGEPMSANEEIRARERRWRMPAQENDGTP